MSGSKKGHSKPTCKFCAQKHVMKKEVCPAWGQTCSKCQKKNHFAVKCPKRKEKKHKKRLHCAKHESSSDDSSSSPSDDCTYSSSDEETVSVVNKKKLKKKLKKNVIKAEMIISGEKVVCQVDSGASVNVISANYVKNAPLSSTKTKLTVYNGASLAPEGKVRLKVKNLKTGQNYRVKFFVVKKSYTPAGKEDL
jgi:hypothetical protein